MHEAARAAALDALEQLLQRVLAAQEAISDVAAAEVRVSKLTVLSCPIGVKPKADSLSIELNVVR